MVYDADVIVIGAGGGGAVAAKELGERGIQVLSLRPVRGTETRSGRSPIRSRAPGPATAPAT